MTADRCKVRAGPEPAAALLRAHATLVRGSDFLARSLEARARPGQAALGGAGGAKVVGNGLRELDRFLCLLIDEGADAIAAPDFDRPAFARASNVANKLATFHRLAGIAAPDAARLRAIGRVRDCLHHCRGVVHDPALWDDLRVAGGEGADEAPGPSERLAVSFAALSRICLFYAQSAAVLMAACRSRPAVS